MTLMRISVRSSAGHCRTFQNEGAAARYAADLTAADEDVLTTILFSDGDLVEFAAISSELPPDVELDLHRSVAVQSVHGIPGADELARALFPHLSRDRGPQ